MTPPGLEELYEVLEELGRGSFGEVYRCRERATGRELAVKVLSALQGEAARQRFQREGEALAQLNHPSIVRVHSAGVAGSRPYLALELAVGADLQDQLETSGPLPPESARDLVVALAEGVAHAHSRGVLHRDLKPENVILSGGRPLLLDFGMASLVDSERLTTTGQMLGTPSYMAPEQVQGSWDERSDVYGLGGLLFACLTAQAPVTGLTLQECLIQITTGAVPDPRHCVPNLPPALVQLCQRSLSKDPAARFASASEFAEALRTASLKPPSKLVPALALLALLVLVLGSSLAVVASQVGPPPSAEPSPLVEVAIESPARPEPARSAEDWARIGKRLLDKGKEGEALEPLSRALDLDPRHTDARLSRGRCLHVRGKIQRAIADFDEVLRIEPERSEAYYCRAVAEWDQARGWKKEPQLGREVETALGYFFRGVTRFRAKDLAGAQEDYTEVIRRRPRFQPAHLNRGNLRCDLGDLRGALSDLNEAVRLKPSVASLLGRSRVHSRFRRLGEKLKDVEAALALKPDDVRALCSLADAKRDLQDLSGAADALARARSLEPENLQVLLGRALLTATKGQLDEARDLYEQVLAREPLQETALNNLAALYMDTNQGALAEPLLQTLLDAKPGDGAALANMAAYLIGEGRYDEAFVHARGATEVAPDNQGFGLTHAAVLSRLGKHEDALAETDRVLAIDPLFAHAHYVRAQILISLRRLKRALKALNRSLQLDKDSVDALHERGTLHLKERRYQAALADFNRALALKPSSRSHVARGHARLQLDDEPGALADYAEALRLDPRATSALNNRAAIMSQSGRYKEALADMDALVAIAPERAYYRMVRAECLFNLGEFAAAQKASAAHLRLAPGDPEGLLMEGRAWQGLGEHRKAIANFDATLLKNPKRLLAILSKATSLDALGEWSAAIKSFERVIKLAKPGTDLSTVRAARDQAQAKLAAAEKAKGER